MGPSLECLTPKELELVQALKAEVAPIVQAHPALQCFCIDWTYVRYMRARNWDLHKAAKMLKATLEWRLEYKPEQIRWEDIAHEAATGKQQITSEVDKEGRPVMLLRPRLENTKPSPSQLQLVVYTLERSSRMADELGVNKLTWLVDCVGFSVTNSPPVKTSLATLNILQNHYPERLGLALCYHAPRIFSVTWSAVSPFIDKVTYKKIKFVNKGEKNERQQMEQHFSLEHFDSTLGGTMQQPMFVLEQYAQRMREGDVKVQAELEAAARNSSATAQAIVAVEKLQLKEGMQQPQQDGVVVMS